MREDADSSLSGGSACNVEEILVKVQPSLEPLLYLMVEDEQGYADVDRVAVVGVAAANLR